MNNEEKAAFLKELAEELRLIINKIDDSKCEEMMILWSFKNDLSDWETSLMIETRELREG